ncbi:sulfurtransferase [Corynebacterium sp. c6VSa_13]|uniref:sulfurtransferase n=1 Tax=Corynebacterium sp. c6VSa_13 TaxID=2913496 RepID=UPI0022BA5C0B|nr:sulfurtransferase [Corynebacterium sp. c6VSa_13]MCZ9309675.1 sulfurtransferase [Corynebacterium sp. c6VSa_13]
MDVLISPAELAERIQTGGKLTVIASRWRPVEENGFARFRAEHIPTSVFCDPASALADIPSSKLGRNPMPDPRRLAHWFEKWGMRHDHEVVVYDGGRGLFSARTWWVLRWAGVERVRILDGGLRAWVAGGYPTLVGPGNPCFTSDLTPQVGAMPVIDIAEVKRWTGLLVDAREPNRYAGRREMLDLKAGHIPGAINVPVRALRREDNTWKSREELAEIFAQHGITKDEDVVVYSGSGLHSALVIAAMMYAGLPAPRHFVGGWSQWCADSFNPVQRHL